MIIAKLREYIKYSNDRHVFIKLNINVFGIFSKSIISLSTVKEQLLATLFRAKQNSLKHRNMKKSIIW